MWGRDKSKKVDFDRHAGKTTMIAQGTKITGNISFTGGLLVEGTVEGNVTAEDSSDALLRLSEAGLIKGDIKVPNVVINGKVTGDVFSSGHVELAAKAVVNGNVHYNLIEMVMGSEVNGSLVHDQPAKSVVASVPVDVAPKEAPIKPKVMVNDAPGQKDTAPFKEAPPLKKAPPAADMAKKARVETPPPKPELSAFDKASLEPATPKANPELSRGNASPAQPEP